MVNIFAIFIAFSITKVIYGIHWIPSNLDVVHNVHIGHHKEIASIPKIQQLRFKIVYDGSVNLLSNEKQNLVKRELMPSAVKYFHNTFSVRNITESIKLQRMCRGNSFFLKDQEGIGPGHLQYCKIACQRTNCGPVSVPESFLDDCRTCDEHGNNCKTKVNDHLSPDEKRKTDFLLFVSSLSTEHCAESNIVAYASYCQQEHALNRPVAGFANLCPDKLENKPQSFESLLSTVKHEIYHALGFSVGLFAFYRDENGKPLTPRSKNGLPEYNAVNNLYQWSEKIVKPVIRHDWSISGGYTDHEIQMIVTPAVVHEVRKHFNCSELEGAELENQGGEGTALTHLEKRLFENEAMTGTYTQHPVFSRISLALMEDTGWYKANYEMAEPLDWGRNLGCLFVKNNCRAWIADRIEHKLSTAPFCATLKQSPLHMRCTHSKLSLALCNLVKYTSELPKEFRYFDRLGQVPVKDINTYGGAVELADFCPFYQKFTLTEEDGRKRGTTCTIAENAPTKNKNYALETYSPNAKCVEHGRHWSAKKELLTRTMLDWGSGCYEYDCTQHGLFLTVGDKRYRCKRESSVIEVTGEMDRWKVNGTLVCPKCEEFCLGKGLCPVEKSPKILVEASASNNAVNLDEKVENAHENISKEKKNISVIHEGNVLILFLIVIFVQFIISK